MKRKQVLLLLLTSCLLLSGCNNGNSNSSSSNLSVGTNEASTNEADGADEDTQAIDNQESDNNQNISQTEESEESAENPITISYDTEEHEYPAENNDIILASTYSYPVVSITNNKTAQDLINANLQENMEENRTYVDSMLESATEYYELAKDNEYYSPSTAYYSYSHQRKDAGIISFECQESFYTGGAHGETVFDGINYDAKTGSLLTLDDIFTEPDSAKEQILAQLSYLASLPYYRALMYEDVDPDVSCLIEEGNWYFGTDGIHFVAQPYALGPYSSGRFDFVIPYEKVPTLKEDYQYDTFLLHTSLVGESLTAYLDGDDNADTIIYDVINPYAGYFETDETEEPAETTFCLEINGKDFSQDFMDAVGYISDNFFFHYYVVDLDESDNYKEIMIADHGPSDDPQTHFFRYENDSLKYLGFITDIPSNDGFVINGDGTVNAIIASNLLQTISLHDVYELNGDTIAPREDTWYILDNEELADEYASHQILTNVTVYKDSDLNSETTTLTPEDGPVIFLSTDNKNWYQLQTKDGDTYYLYMTDFQTVPNEGTDMNAFEIFDNLFVAG